MLPIAWGAIWTNPTRQVIEKITEFCWILQVVGQQFVITVSVFVRYQPNLYIFALNSNIVGYYYITVSKKEDCKRVKIPFCVCSLFLTVKSGWSPTLSDFSTTSSGVVYFFYFSTRINCYCVHLEREREGITSFSLL